MGETSPWKPSAQSLCLVLTSRASRAGRAANGKQRAFLRAGFSRRQAGQGPKPPMKGSSAARNSGTSHLCPYLLVYPCPFPDNTPRQVVPCDRCPVPPSTLPPKPVRNAGGSTSRRDRRGMVRGRATAPRSNRDEPGRVVTESHHRLTPAKKADVIQETVRRAPSPSLSPIPTRLFGKPRTAHNGNPDLPERLQCRPRMLLTVPYSCANPPIPPSPLPSRHHRFSASSAKLAPMTGLALNCGASLMSPVPAS